MDSGDVRGVIERYRTVKPDLDLVAEFLESRLAALLRDAGIHGAVSARAKDVRSFGQKIFRKGYADPWAEVTDKVGGRVVVSLTSDVDRVARLVADLLLRPETEDKRRILDPSKLEYSGVHVTGTLPNAPGTLELALVEVQIRTIVQDAWSAVSHGLVYKPVLRLPMSEQRSIMRLVALAEIFDEEVARVIGRVEADPGYELVPIILLAESAAFSVGIFEGDRIISFNVLEAIRSTLPDNLEEYGPMLNEFVSREKPRIAHLVAQRGPASEAGSLWENLLVGQPESVIIMERLSATPFALMHAWEAAALPIEALTPFKILLGVRDP